MDSIYDIKEIKKQIDTLSQNLGRKRRENLNIIIKKLSDHPIAISDVHYKFLKEIEQDLKEYNITYNL